MINMLANIPVNEIPLWIKIAYTLMVFMIVPIYWKKYGPINFLWLSDVALFLMFFAIWFENRLISSMMALGVLPLELLWLLDLISGARLGGVARYMFNKKLPLYLRALSLFHIVLIIMIVYFLLKFGYDPRALPLQILLIWILFPLSYLIASKVKDHENINWVFGLSDKPKKKKHPILYLIFLLLGITIFIYLPWHWVLKFFF